MHTRHAITLLTAFSAFCCATAATSPYDPPEMSEEVLATTQTQKKSSVETGTIQTVNAPFRDALMPPLLGWNGNVFRLSQNYPAKIPQDAQPWLSFDPIKDPRNYVQSVLNYFYDGNLRDDVETSFNPALNQVRHWYNAPWQDYGINGREFVHGLTRERVSEAYELDPKQKSLWNNYAVGFYNAPGGQAIGAIWADHKNPDVSKATMPEGTVAAKLLFTTATVDEVPYLAGSPEWKTYIYAKPNDRQPTATSPRAILTVRLLQIDVAVKDRRGPTGWVFGTFVYGGEPGGKPGSGWRNVYPIGLMWGNDPNYSGVGPLVQTWINPDVNMPHLGYQGRLNGPVDNKVSSCLSCHSTAEIPAPLSMIPVGANTAPWFRNIPSGTPFNGPPTSVDYSLQVMVGLNNFQKSQEISKALSPDVRSSLIQKFEAADLVPARDGGGK